MKAPSNTAFLTPTVQGCYALATVSRAAEEDLRVLRWLLHRSETPAFDQALLDRIHAEVGVEATEHIRRLRRAGYVRLQPRRIRLPRGGLEASLARALAGLSPHGHGALIDANGLCIAAAGFDPRHVGALAALASKLMDALSHEDHALTEVLGLGRAYPCILDVEHKKPVLFFPIQIGDQRFSAVIVGKPVMRAAWFRDMVWILWHRYADQPTATTQGELS